MKQRPFFFFLILSVSAHLLLFAGLPLLSLFESSPRPMAIFPGAVKVGLAALPDLPSPPAPQKAKPPVKKKTGAKPLKKRSLEPSSAEKPGRPQKEEAAAEEPAEAPERAGPDKENQLSEEKSGEGQGAAEGEPAKNGYTEEQKQAAGAYLSLVISRIKSHWDLPKYLMDESLFAELEIKISDQGEIVEKSLVTSSLNDLFDRRVLAAMEKAAPFPPPPEEIRRIISDGIVFGFP